MQFSNGSLSGEVPASFISLTVLRHLDLARNYLSGAPPHSWPATTCLVHHPAHGPQLSVWCTTPLTVLPTPSVLALLTLSLYILTPAAHCSYAAYSTYAAHFIAPMLLLCCSYAAHFIAPMLLTLPMLLTSPLTVPYAAPCVRSLLSSDLW